MFLKRGILFGHFLAISRSVTLLDQQKLKEFSEMFLSHIMSMNL